MSKQEAYEKATLECLSNPNGTRMDIIYRAMDIYCESQNSKPVVNGEPNGVSVLIKALKDIYSWTDEMEDEWGDPGERAKIALNDYNAGRSK